MGWQRFLIIFLELLMYKCVTNIQRFSLYTLANFCVWKWKFSVWEPDMLCALDLSKGM